MYKGRRERLSGLPNFVPRAFCLYGGKWSWHHPVTRHPEFSLGCFDMANQIIESSGRCPGYGVAVLLCSTHVI